LPLAFSDNPTSRRGMMEETILIVDDEKDICEVLGISLSDLGYKVHTAGDGEEALRVFEKTRPSIVLTDIRMPGMDGIELLRRIKRHNPDTEVIMITGHGDIDLAIESLKLEATDFITKPIDDELLEIALKRARDRISSRQKMKEYTEGLERRLSEQSERLAKAERLIAAGQSGEELSSAMENITKDIEGGLAYFKELPCLVCIYNRDYEVVATNELYKKRIGDRVGYRSWQIYGLKQGEEGNSPAGRTFETGKGQRSREIIRDAHGREIPVLVHTAPIRNKNNEPELVIEISADLTEATPL
jgi:FixJ family two-component response regulator